MKLRFLAPIAGFLGLVAPAAYATDFTMSAASVPAGLAADIVGAGSAGTTFSLSVIAGTVGAVLILGIVGWVLVKLSSIMAAALHIGRR